MRCDGKGRGARTIEDLRDLPIERYPHDLLLGHVRELRGDLCAHGAAYVVLAEALAAPLLTRDARLARSSGHRARIEMA